MLFKTEEGHEKFFAQEYWKGNHSQF